MSESFNQDSEGRYNPVKRRNDEGGGCGFLLFFCLAWCLTLGNLWLGGETYETAVVVEKQMNGGRIFPGLWTLIIIQNDAPLEITVTKQEWEAATVGGSVPICREWTAFGKYSISSYDRGKSSRPADRPYHRGSEP